MSDRSSHTGRRRAMWVPSRALTAEVLRLATPVTLGTLTFTLLSIVDTAMLGRLGAVPLAASGVAGVIYFALVFPMSSMSVGTQTLVARRVGEGNHAQCGPILNTAFASCLVLGIPLVIAAPWLARLFAPISSADPDVMNAGAAYLHYRFFGSPFMLINFVSRGFFAGIGKTKHQLIGSILITLVNLVLDYILIFGKAGAPPMGIRGAAMASSIALAAGSVYYLSVLTFAGYRARYDVGRRPWFAGRWLRPIVRLSLPIVTQRILSNGAWAIFFTIIARIGTVELAAANVIRSIYSLSIMIAIGLGVAAAALLGQNLGARQPERAERMTWTSVQLASFAMLIVGILFLTIPTAIFRIYTSEVAVLSAGRLPLMLLGIVQPFAGIALVLSNALQGAGNTRYVMLVEFVCIAVYLPTVYLLGLRTPLGLLGAWTGEYIYWLLLAVAMFWKFRQGTWKTIIV